MAALVERVVNMPQKMPSLLRERVPRSILCGSQSVLRSAPSRNRAPRTVRAQAAVGSFPGDWGVHCDA